MVFVRRTTRQKDHLGRSDGRRPHRAWASAAMKPTYTFANCMMSFVEVEVDTETGKVDLLRVVNATDVGQIIDPPGLEGQLNGCLGSAGIDSAIFEETVRDSTTGHMLNANMIDYKWRTFAELPPIDNVVTGDALSDPPLPCHRGGRGGDVARSFGRSDGGIECRRHVAPRVPRDARKGAQGP